MSTDFTKPFQENLESAGVNVLTLPEGKVINGATFFDVTFGPVPASAIRPAFAELANNVKNDANLVVLRSARVVPSNIHQDHVVLSASLAAYQLSESLSADTFKNFESGFVASFPEPQKVNEETGEVEPKEPPFAEEAVIPTPEESSAAALIPLENPIPVASLPLNARREEKMAVNQQKYPEHASEGVPLDKSNSINAQGSVQGPDDESDFSPLSGVAASGDAGHVEGTTVTESREQPEERKVDSPLDNANTNIITHNTDMSNTINAQGSIQGPGDESDMSMTAGVVEHPDAAQQEVYVDDGDSHDADGSQLAEGETENSGLPASNPNSDENSDQGNQEENNEENSEEENSEEDSDNNDDESEEDKQNR